MAKLIKIFWRDIPSQVTAKAGRKSAKVLLPERFQVAIDRAAMRAGKGTTDEYLEDWSRVQTEVSGDLDSIAAAAAEQLIEAFPEERLEALTRAKGVLADIPGTDTQGADTPDA